MVKYREIAIQVLKEKKEYLTPREIWNYAIENKMIDVNIIEGKTPEATLASLLLRETKKGTYKGGESVFLHIDSPRRYMIKDND